MIHKTTRMQKIAKIFFFATLLSGCASMRDSLILGGTMGAGAGAIMGNGIGKGNPKSTAIGAASGAAFGALMGYFGNKDEVRKERDRQAQLDALQGAKPRYPSVSKPEVRAIWVPDKIENDQFVSGHYIYVIDKPATFRKEQ